jgi:hypothetical protein
MMQLRKHFNKNHPGVDFEQEQVKFEEQKNSFDSKKDVYTCNYLPKGKAESKNAIPCGKKFSNIQEKILHMRQCHVPEKKFKCIAPKCIDVFDRPFLLRKHLERHHPDIKVDGNLKENGCYYNGFEKARASRKENRIVKPIDERCRLIIDVSDGSNFICYLHFTTVQVKHNHLKNAHSIYWCPSCTCQYTNELDFEEHYKNLMGSYCIKGKRDWFDSDEDEECDSDSSDCEMQTI